MGCKPTQRRKVNKDCRIQRFGSKETKFWYFVFYC